MCNQLKVEFFKLRHFGIFYIVAVCMAGFGLLHGIKLARLGFDIYYAFTAANCDTSFLFLLALVSAWFIGGDFSSRTIHHEITLGYSRWSVLAVRELPVYMAAIMLHFKYIIFTMLGVAIKTGFSGGMFGIQDLFWCITILLQLISLQSIIVFISFICAKASAAIAASICFIFIMCNVLRNFLEEEIFTRSVFCLAQDSTFENLIYTSVVAVLTLAVTVFLTNLVFRKKEIK